MNTLKLDDCTILMEGKRYLWSGRIDKLYNVVIWKDNWCKITKINHNKKQVSVYESSDRKEYTYSFERINDFSFKPWWKFFRIW